MPTRFHHLVVLFLFTTLAVNLRTATSFSAPSLRSSSSSATSSSGSSSRLLAAADHDTLVPLDTEASIIEASNFFVDNYYNSAEKPKDLYDLSSAQFLSSYAPLLTPRTFPSTLYFSPSLGLICGQTCLLSSDYSDLIRPSKSLDMYTSKMSSLSPKIRRTLKGKSIHSIISTILPDYTTTTLLSNLIIPPPLRRSGNAKKLIDKLESTSSTSTVSLFVNENNVGARELYKGRGYENVGRAYGNTEVHVMDDGSVGERDVDEVFMIKELRKVKSGGI
ncbi:hypothetical protein TrVE_jg5607 [Triparma verrucosa]|uniref:N-acetyltransferase domain-containing protein n=1 Tax=Triparma verrucosa TaxID=1606542 RepID=A0A9W7EPC6_9STRA|nr:hypothetical protein TrVE_jg5607 [Triparma verrucosa]